VSYSTREGAERAIREVGGTQIGSRVVRCGWAHHKRDTLQGADYLTIDQARSFSALEMSLRSQCNRQAA